MISVKLFSMLCAGLVKLKFLPVVFIRHLLAIKKFTKTLIRKNEKITSFLYLKLNQFIMNNKTPTPLFHIKTH